MNKDSIIDDLNSSEKLVKSINMILEGLNKIARGSKGETDKLLENLHVKIELLEKLLVGIDDYMKQENELSVEEKQAVVNFFNHYKDILRQYSELTAVFAEKIRELKQKANIAQKRVNIKNTYGV